MARVCLVGESSFIWLARVRLVGEVGESSFIWLVRVRLFGWREFVYLVGESFLFGWREFGNVRHTG